MEREILSEEPYGNWTIRHERWRVNEDDDWTPIQSVYNAKAQYIGDTALAHNLHDRGIEPEYAQPDHRACSIGFCNKEQKWYGWSHRAMFGFGVGHVTEAGDCQATSGWIDDIDPRTGEPDALVIPVGFETKNLDDCKRVAIAFGASVS